MKTVTKIQELESVVNEITVRLNDLAKRNFYKEICKLCSTRYLKEETVQKYFTFLIQKGLNEINFSLSSDKLASELDYVNINLRYNKQLEEKGIEEDYFEGSSFEEFKTDFEKYVNSQQSLKEDPELRRRIMTVFNNYCEWFKNKSSKLNATWKDKK